MSIVQEKKAIRIMCIYNDKNKHNANNKTQEINDDVNKEH